MPGITEHPLADVKITSVHIVAQRANRHIVAFHIAISYDTDGGCTSVYWSDRQWCAVCGCIHLQTQIRRIFRICGLMWLILLQFSCWELYMLWLDKLLKDIKKLWLLWILSQDVTASLLAVTRLVKWLPFNGFPFLKQESGFEFCYPVTKL